MKTVTIETLAEKLEGKLWVKGDLKRIYLDSGYNTKKMSTKTYVYQKENGTYVVVCNTDCPSQNSNWIKSQENQIIESLNNSIENIIEEFGHEIVNPQIAIDEALAKEEQVQGYYMRWHEVRIAINRYGKLADRKRQMVHTYKGAISIKPAGFIELNDDDFAKALQFEQKETKFEYGNEPQF